MLQQIIKQKHIKSSELLFIGAVIFVVLFTSLVHGLIPHIPLVFDYNRYGAIGCGAQNIIDIFQANCPITGGDVGRIYATGLTAILIGSILHLLIPFGVVWTFSIVGIFFICIGLFGTYKLIRYLGVSRYIALGGAFIYLLSPIVISMHSFGGTYWGVLSLPFALYVVWWLLNLKMETGLKRGVLITGLWILLSIAMVFSDGYSFVMYTAASGIMLTVWAWKKWFNREVLLAGSAYIVGTLIAYFLYKLNIPAADSWASPISTFRSMGLDLVTLFNPYWGFWWAQLLGIGNDTSSLWGDGSNSSYNYIGLPLVVLAGAGMYFARKKLSRLGFALIIIAAMSFILSLGPSLKINSQNISNPGDTGYVKRSPYRMPESEAVLSLPTTHAYKLPGLKAMRATYRWHVITVLVLIIFACLALQLLIQNKNSKLAYLLLALLILHFAPNPITMIHYGGQVWKKVSAFQSEIIVPLKESLTPGDRVVYFPNARGDNDFLVNYLTPETKTWTYNVGGDKAVALAREHYPETITRLIRADHDLDSIAVSGEHMLAAIKNGYINKIVIPKFGLKWNAGNWPPSNEQAIEKAAIAASAAKKVGLTVVEEDFFYIAGKTEK